MEKCKSGELQINCDGKSTARLCRFARRRTISGITKRLPFEDLDFYVLFRVTFENSELGRMKLLLPLHEMAVNFGLVGNRHERKRGPKPFFIKTICETYRPWQGSEERGIWCQVQQHPSGRDIVH